MAGFPPISVRQPQPFDLVDDPVEVAGVGTGFEGVFAARVRDGNGAQLVQVTINAGGTGIWANYRASLALGAVPATPQGTLEVFESSAKDGSDINKGDLTGMTALMRAVEIGRVEDAKRFLADGADPNAKDNQGQTALHFASQRGDVSTIRSLLAAKATPGAKAKADATSSAYRGRPRPQHRRYDER